MIDNETVYGIEFYSQDHMKPGFVLTLTGKEIKKLLQLLKKDLKKDVQTFQKDL
jgi:hypothetical protein